jgi:Zn-dependent protease with chaperone function
MEHRPTLSEAMLDRNLYFAALGGAVSLPLLWTLVFGLLTLRLDVQARSAKWPAYLQAMRALNLLAIPAWWSICGAFHVVTVRGDSTPGWTAWVLLILPLTIGIVAGRLVAFRIGRTFYSKRWTNADLLGLTVWRTLSSTVALLMFAAGVDAINPFSFASVFWIGSAAVLALYARIRLQRAEGFKPRPVKSGEVFKQSFAMAQKMGLRLKGIFVVPTGKGRLINAYSLPGYIGMTDVCVHRLKSVEREFIIGHELAHIHLKHGNKTLRIVAGVYLAMVALSFLLPHLPLGWQILLKSGLILVPLLVFNAVSRRHEYEADRASVEFTGNAETAIRALSSLYSFSGVPPKVNRLQELFFTHPSLLGRVGAIARAGQVSAESVDKIRRQFEDEAERLAVRI